MNTLDSQIFDFLYNYHLAEKAAGREFYFALNPQIEIENEQFCWFGLRLCRSSFWNSIQNEVEIYFEIISEEKIRLYISIENPQLYDFVSLIANELTWKNTNPNEQDYDRYFSNRIYYKDYHLKDFIKGDKKRIDEYFGEKLRKIAKEEFEAKLFIGHFELSLIDKNYLPESRPSYLAHLHIQNFKGIKNVTIENIQKNTQWIFFTGENGIGKTLLLQAIALSLFETEELTNGELEVFQKENTCLGVVKYLHFTRKIHTMTFYRLGFQAFKNAYRNFAFFGASRLETLNNGKKNNKTAHILGKTNQLANVDNWLFDTKTNRLRQNQFQLLKEALCQILDLKDIDIDIVAKRMIYFEKESDKPVFFEQLSAGSKNIINLIGNIVIELAGSERLEKLENLHGIVIIDEIEAHLHPKMQRFLVEKLTELFPKVQFIVSTHSPIPLLGAPKDTTAIFHVERTKEKGITVERLDKIMEDKDLSANTLLASRIFNFSS